jgi:hypothetical protein
MNRLKLSKKSAPAPPTLHSFQAEERRKIDPTAGEIYQTLLSVNVEPMFNRSRSVLNSGFPNACSKTILTNWAFTKSLLSRRNV